MDHYTEVRIIKLQVNTTLWMTFPNMRLQSGYTVSRQNLSVYHSFFIYKMMLRTGSTPDQVKVEFQ